VAALRGFVPHIVVTHPCDPEDNLALVDQLGATFAGIPGVAQCAATLRGDIERELAAPVSAANERVLYLIWHDPWMTVARDTYISRMLARIGWHTEPAIEGGATGAARYPALRGDEPWLGGVQRVLLASDTSSRSID